jgi:hypothetical protein
MEKSDHPVVIVGSTQIVSHQSLVLATHVLSCSDVVSSFLRGERLNKAGDVYAKSVQQIIKGLINCSRAMEFPLPVEANKVLPRKADGLDVAGPNDSVLADAPHNLLKTPCHGACLNTSLLNNI